MCDPAAIHGLIEWNRRGTMAAEHHLYKLVPTQILLATCIDDGSG
jgi:hypothetical protein